MATSTQLAGTAVAGYFASGHDAHRAINALIDAGFAPSEIGAAFHAGLGSASATETTGGLREEVGATGAGFPPNRSRATGGGAASDTSSVQYGALGGGAGTPINAPSRPGPLPGADVTHSGLPSELRQELPHENQVENQVQAGRLPAREEVGVSRGAAATPAPEQTTTPAKEASWGERLKHIFGGGRAHDEALAAKQSAAGDPLPADARKTAQEFGTGEGRLGLTPQRRYSQTAFEQSFSGYGIEPERARGFGRGLRQGGAVVTVHAGPRAMEAERILELHGGAARLATDTEVDGNLADEGYVEVLGTVGRDYPSYLD